MKKIGLTLLALLIAVGLLVLPASSLLKDVSLNQPTRVLADDGDPQPGEELIGQRTRTSKTTYLGETPAGGQRYALDASIGSIHYKDDPDNATELWKDIDTTIQPSDRANWDWEVIKGNWHLLINADTSVAVGKDGNWIGFRYEGFAYYDTSTGMYQILDSRRDVTPTISGNKIRWEGLFYGVNLEYTYGNDRFKEDLEVTQLARDWLALNPPSSFGLNNATSYLVGYLECDWREAYPAEDDLGNAISFDNLEIEGKSIFWRHPVKDYLVTALPIGYAMHEEVAPEDWLPIRQRFYKAENGKHYLLFGSKVGLLNQMPSGTIVIDPTLDPQVGAQNDDCYAATSQGAGGWDLASVRFNAGAYDGSNYGYFGGARFQTIAIDQGLTIDTAYLILECSAQFNGADCRTKLSAEAIDDAPEFSSYADYWARTKTDTKVDWDISTVWTVGNSYNSTEIKTVIQEVVDRGGWASGQDMVIFWEDDSSPTAANNLRRAGSYDHATAVPPTLHIEYSEVGVVAPTVTSDNSSLVEETTATLSGNITATGGENCTARGFFYDIDSGAPYADNSTQSGNFSVGIFSANLIGLTKGELYYWHASANNSVGSGNGTELTFLTKPDPPNTFTATASGDLEITLAWANGTGADNTTITRKIGSYPANRADGVNVYDNTGTGHVDTDNISAGSTYYYRAWSWCTEGALVQYSDTYDEDNATAFAVVAPTVTSSNATAVGVSSATLSGNITSTGNENASLRGFEWGIASGNYTDNWTEGGSFGTGVFTHGISGLSENTTYFWRAFAENSAGFGYSGELSFTTGVTPPAPPIPIDMDANVYLMIRPDLDEAIVRANGKPTHVNIGIFDGYSLPIYNNDDEELFFNVHVSKRWNGTTDIIVHMIVSIASAEDNKTFNLEVAWEHLTPGVDIVPVTSHSVTVETNIGPSAAQYQTYYPQFRLDYDIDSPDIVEYHDDLALRVRRLAASANETTNEIIIHHLGVMFMRGDLLGDPDIVITEDDMEDLAAQVTVFNVSFAEILAIFLALLVVALFSVLAFWRPNALLFMLAAGASIMIGLYWFDAYTTNLGLSIGLMLIAYSLVCLGFAFRHIFWKGDISGG